MNANLSQWECCIAVVYRSPNMVLNWPHQVTIPAVALLSLTLVTMAILWLPWQYSGYYGNTLKNVYSLYVSQLVNRD